MSETAKQRIAEVANEAYLAAFGCGTHVAAVGAARMAAAREGILIAQERLMAMDLIDDGILGELIAELSDVPPPSEVQR